MTGAGAEEPLSGGNASAGVVRVGDTVRKPWLSTSKSTIDFMKALRERGIDVPEPRGRDEQGRLALEYVAGEMAIDRGPLDTAILGRIGALVRSIHDASAGLAVPQGQDVLLPVEQPDLMCHNDLAAWNLVINGDRLVFIDWDGAGPSTRLWDLAYAAISFGHLFPGGDVHEAAGRLAAFVNGYDADEQLRPLLPATLAHRAAAMHDMLRRSHHAGREPWGSMFVNGHGELWEDTAAYVAQHEVEWAGVLLP